VNVYEFHENIVQDVAKFHADPLGFVMYAFPWGEGELEGFDGPDEWQRAALIEIRDGIKLPNQVVREAIASGHGIGKSAFVAWLILWAMSTREDTRGVVTANTDTQLRTKTWPELVKWKNLSVNKFMFECTATALYSTQEGHEKNWRFDLIPWSERNTEAFAGLHNKGKRILLVMDEGSSIPDIIWETSEGAMTDEGTEIIWFVAGNPTRNTGRFRECFGNGRFAHRWKTRQIDSRTARMANKAQIAEWVADYGEDSDFVRIRVRGVFPRAGSTQFIGSDLIEAAQAREVVEDLGAPLIMSVDVARFGDDQSVIRWRKGHDARSIPPRKYRGVDTMKLAGFVAEWATNTKPQVIFIDGNGVGGGVVDRVRQLQFPVIEVQFGASARNERDYFNKRAECYGLMRDWLTTAACIDVDPKLRDDLGSLQYGFDKNNRIQLEKKSDMKKRGLASPDDGDTLAMTFAHPVARLEMGFRPGQYGGPPEVAQTDYDPFNAEAA
jgi:hypothetical protein